MKRYGAWVVTVFREGRAVLVGVFTDKQRATLAQETYGPAWDAATCEFVEFNTVNPDAVTWVTTEELS